MRFAIRVTLFAFVYFFNYAYSMYQLLLFLLR